MLPDIINGVHYAGAILNIPAAATKGRERTIHQTLYQVGGILLITGAFAMILLPLFLRDYASLKTVLGRPLDPAYQRTVLIIYGILHMVEGLLLLQLSPIGWALALATTCMGILGNLSAGFASAGLQSSPTGVSPGIGATLAWGPLLTGVIILLYLFYTRSLFSETASGSRIEGFRDAPDSPTPRSGPRGSTPE